MVYWGIVVSFRGKTIIRKVRVHDLAKRWGIQQATCRPERVYAADEIEGAQIAVEDFPIIAHLTND